MVNTVKRGWAQLLCVLSDPHSTALLLEQKAVVVHASHHYVLEWSPGDTGKYYLSVLTNTGLCVLAFEIDIV